MKPKSGQSKASKKSQAARKQSEKMQLAPRLPAHVPGRPETESGQPGGGAGRIEITGVVPDVIEVDPDLTEGHPGYEDSGDSGLRPPSQKGTAG